MFQVTLDCSLWDLADEGIDVVLDRLQGEAGAGGVSVAACHPRVDQLRPHAGVSPRRFRSEGGAQFQPDLAHYAGTRIRPVVADWLRKRNVLPAVAEACARRGLVFHGRAVCCHNPALVDRHEAAAIKDAFGNPDPRWLCPIHPDVREYLRALVEDLSANYPFESLELESASFPGCQRAHEGMEIGFDLGHLGQWLRSLCFCESCRQCAWQNGVDATAAARSTTVLLERLAAGAEPANEPLPQFLDREPVLNAYVQWRCEQITSLWCSIRQSCRCRLVIQRGGCRRGTGVDSKAIAPHVDALLVTCDGLDDRKVDSAIHLAIEQAGGAERAELRLPATSPACPDSATLVRSVHQAARAGLPSASISDYGLLPLSRMDWIKQAVRYARRESN